LYSTARPAGSSRLAAASAGLGRPEPSEMPREPLVALVTMQTWQIEQLRVENSGPRAWVEPLTSRNNGNSSMPPSIDDPPGRTPPAEMPRRDGPARADAASSPVCRGVPALAWFDHGADNQDSGTHMIARAWTQALAYSCNAEGNSASSRSAVWRWATLSGLSKAVPGLSTAAIAAIRR
jgi:hypothetical protein